MRPAAHATGEPCRARSPSSAARAAPYSPPCRNPARRRSPTAPGPAILARKTLDRYPYRRRRCHRVGDEEWPILAMLLDIHAQGRNAVQILADRKACRRENPILQIGQMPRQILREQFEPAPDRDAEMRREVSFLDAFVQGPAP